MGVNFRLKWKKCKTIGLACTGQLTWNYNNILKNCDWYLANIQVNLFIGICKTWNYVQQCFLKTTVSYAWMFNYLNWA